MKYLFTCANRNCECLTEKVGLYFFTTSQEKAVKHSKENNSPMWISEHSTEEIEEMYNTLKKMGVKNE